MNCDALVPNQSSYSCLDCKPVTDTSYNQQPSTISLTKTERRETKTADIEARYSNARDEIHTHLKRYGPNGEPTNNTGPNGKQTLPGTPERNWSSRRANKNFVHAYLSGSLEAQRRLRVKNGSQRPSDLDSDFDYEAYREAGAALESWSVPTKPRVAEYYYDGLGYRLRKPDVAVGAVEPLGAVAAQDVSNASTESSQAHLEAYSVSVELVEALTQRSGDLWKADVQAGNHVKPKLKISDGHLQDIYERYLKDPVNEVDNLTVAVMTHVKTRFLSKLKNKLRDEYEWIEASDLITEFSINIARKIVVGKYSTELGKLSNWISSCWSNFLADSKETFYTEKNTTTRLDNRDNIDDEFEIIEAEKFYINPSLVDLEQHKRDVTDDADSPANRIERVLRQLDDPDTQFGKLDAATKAIIRGLAAGTTVKDVSKAVGLCRRQVDRKLKELSKLKQHSFRPVPRKLRPLTDDVAKGGRLYTVRVEDFEREVAR